MELPTSSSAAHRGPRDRKAAVSLASLSAHLRLSQAVISRVLNGSPGASAIPKGTQDRIFAAARELNYRPNALARSLRQGRSMMIGVLVPEISEGYATLVLAGLEKALLQAEYFFLLISHHHSTDVIERSLRMLAARAVDGLVAIDTKLRYDGPLPLVTISCPNDSVQTANIILDHARAAELAFEHLYRLGHRRIAVIKGQSFSSDTQARWQAICAASAALDLELDPALVVELQGDAPTHEPGYQAAQQLLGSGKPFTALFAFNDVSAIGASRAFREAGLLVPEDLSIIGFDDVQSAAYQAPGLTTVRQPLAAMGILAGHTVLERITQVEQSLCRKTLIVEPELVIRESTGPARCQP